MLEKKIEFYKKKYYKSSLVRGVLLFSALVLSYFLLLNITEYFAFSDPTVRRILFFSFVAVCSFAFLYWIAVPCSKLFNLSRTLSQQEAAKKIGTHFPEISDKLLNTLQLKNLVSNQKNKSDTLLHASVLQREENLTQFKFSDAINYNINKKYLKYLLPPFLLASLILLFAPQLLTESTPRLIHFNKKFEKKALFSFKITNKTLQVFKNEDFNLDINLEGTKIPDKIYLLTKSGRKLVPNKKKQGSFSYTFKKVQKEINFWLEGAGVQSQSYKIHLIERPALLNFSVQLNYPSYTKKPNERIKNTGNLSVPEGTWLSWIFETKVAETLSLKFENKENLAKQSKNNTFTFKKRALKAEKYQINLKNKNAQNKDIIEYFLDVKPDRYPTLNVNGIVDTVLYEHLILGGNIGDDYGISNLQLKYKVKSPGENQGKTTFQTKNIPFNKQLPNQSFFYRLNLDNFSLQDGDELLYYVIVFDNDGVHGPKSTKSKTFTVKMPSKDAIKQAIKAQSEGTKKEMYKRLQESDKLNKDLKSLQNKLKGKKNLSWQDKKAIQNLINRHKQQEKNIAQLQKMHKLFGDQQEKLSNTEIAEKVEQLQKLMDEVLDEKTQKLYDELDKLMKENLVNDKIQESLESIEIKQENIKNELDRALELFKKLKFEAKLDEIKEDLKTLAKKQEAASEKTKDAQKEESEDLKKEQEQLNEEFEELEKSLDELKKLNEDTNNPKPLENFEDHKESISEKQKDTKDALEEKALKKAFEKQKDAAEEMRKMAKKMAQMQKSVQMQQITENYNDLRAILENLITLSFNQEELMVGFRKVQKIDPKFVVLSQKQLKLKDDAQVIKDSLFALSKRVFQIESFVTREVSQMNKYMEGSLDAIKQRIPEMASGKQQFTMTSINNLAVFLSDILKQMQTQMSQSMSGKQNNQKKEKGSSPSLSDLQKQLNKELNDLKKSGKTGKALSKALAKLAAEQAFIRNAMKVQQMKKEQKHLNGEDKEGDAYKEMLEKMEKTEEDLANKQLTNDIIRRQKEILTRLLESEKAERTQELDEKREAEQARQYARDKQMPKEFLEYIKLKEAQIELLKTIPALLNRYYKKQANEYFKKLGND